MSVYDDRMIEIANQSRPARELAELEAGTAAIEAGTRNPVLWAFIIGGLLAAPFTWGISLIVSLVAGIAMNGGPAHMVKAALPMSVDIVAPRAGCIRLIAGLLTIVLVIIAALLIGCVILFLMVQP